MSHPRFKDLQEKLLRAGIAPRHVRRYLGELRQHYDDLLSEENAAGITGAAAEQAACARLGSDDDLAAAMLDQPEMRSVSARFPWAVFGIAPLFLVVLVCVSLLGVEIGFITLYEHIGPVFGADVFSFHPWMKKVGDVWGWLIMYATPFIAVAILCLLGTRQRLATRWLLLGGFFCAFLGAWPMGYSMKFATAPGNGELTLGAGFSADASLPRVLVNIAIIATMIALQWWFTRRKAIS